MANSAELIVAKALAVLAPVDVYPDEAPEGAARPFVTYQSVGGQSPNILDGVLSNQNARMQVTVWADDRLTAINLMQRIIAELTGPAITAVTIGAPVSIREQDTRLRGSRQDFSIWFLP